MYNRLLRCFVLFDLKVKTEGEYFDWINGPVDPAEKLLAEKVGDFSEMFGDMVFEEGSITNREDNVQPYEDYTDFGFWSIYYKVEQSLIDDVVENLMSECAFDRNGGHDILSLLKSIDLDIRMGYSLGTVFHYGGDEIFEKYRYKPGDLVGE